ncbi:hypothetical protein [Cylindrospermopsis raciborskii]|uniref:Uncharacterized protein n=3 Tax=Cylindrospermopsis raciborskii TaxID=77022 RepID=A0A853M828_9CYAN|nr:hypothetical protein [Cylindrospermopsis raciborskii]PNJ92459.1 hypothetical protein CEP14_15010 [Cylindrospermopsis raciborskii C04]PNJ93864.1 hypothetical protein CEP13_11815 [Cylindrospermopsis raciborskii C03]EFA69682.1 conserved hypothetical protein [Cylindrospermopsis raciborskii CS-505]MBA4444835.1 hypothetical protein [Cylindrospermopsis raciborskii CS-506_C]MBA4449047.1 hypothetical protein [Cylindrospermopsis raciborskii CS-506_D]
MIVKSGSYGYKKISLLLFILLTATLTNIVKAHTVKVSNDIGATIHIEPNDRARAGEVAPVWFALTQKGGKTVSLRDCNCHLAIYAQPHTPGEPALLEPPLKPMNVERYEGIPGAEITFPKPGVYELQLTGKPRTGENWQPFELKFEVMVATGNPILAQGLENTAHKSGQSSKGLDLVKLMLIGASIISLIGIIVFLVKHINVM